MRVLLDECLPKKLKAIFSGHDCLTVPEAGVAGRKNGHLLSFAEERGFNVFVTLDKGIQYQQNLTGRNIAVLLIRARSNRLVDLLPYSETCIASLAVVQSGQLVVVGDD